MNLTKTAISVLLVITLAVPAMAASDWVGDFLRRYDPEKKVPTAAPTTPSLGQLVRTGELPVTMSDVINLMIDYNLDIRSNRLGPRSSY
jgi:hypothetical protein